MTRQYKFWTGSEDAIVVAMVEKDIAVKNIASHLDRSKSSVEQHINVLGINYPSTHYKRRGQENRVPFGERIEKFITFEPNSGCWIWTGSVDGGGYAHAFGFENNLRKFIRVHRWTYENINGPIPQGLVIDHLCRVRCCVNPAHLEAVTHRENCRRGNCGKWKRTK